MRQIPLANCNVSFIKKGIEDNKRIDIRHRSDSRNVNLIYGNDYGSCVVELGGTIISASCCCEIVTPKLSRPSDGLIQINLDLSSGCQDWLDLHNRQMSPEGISCIRLLERTIRDSHCIDTESLCLIKGEKVWQIKCDLTCLNYEGNLVESASIAAIASLAHFKRPDVTVSADGEITIYSFEDKYPLSLGVLHFPFCVSFIFFKDSHGTEQNNYHIVCDPNELEQQICEGSLVIGANSYCEILTIHCTGKSRIDHKKISYCSTMAVERVKKITKIVKEALEIDKQNRIEKKQIGFSTALQNGELFGKKKILLSQVDVKTLESTEQDQIMIDDSRKENTSLNVYEYGRGIVGIGEGGPSTWQFQQIHDENQDHLVDLTQLSDRKTEIKVVDDYKRDSDQDDEDDEEDEVVILNPTEFKT